MIYLLPGMGATSSMYGGQWSFLPDTKAVDWPEYCGERSIREVADRLIDEHRINEKDIVAGSSLGGLVALEIHRGIGLVQAVLIGSAVDRGEINRLLIAVSPLAKITPMHLIQHLAGKVDNILSAMFANVDAEFVRAMCGAILRSHKSTSFDIVDVNCSQ